MDVVLVELLRKASSVDSDVRLRSLALQRQCETLKRVCAFVRSLETSAVEQKVAQQAETSALEQSIQDAIRRARKVRTELATGGRDSDHERDDGHAQPPDAEDQQLESILNVARATRAAQQPQETVGAKTETPAVGLEYPRKLKALETQLEDLRLKEREASTHFAFCCKMSEHLSLSTKRRQLILQQQQLGPGRMNVPVARIQTSFPKQVARLRGGYQRLAEFMLEKVEVDSPKFQQVADAPTFASVFPIYHRLKQAKKMLRLLNSEAKALLERLPASPPTLSTAAVAHRDAILKRIRRKQPKPDVGVIYNIALQAVLETHKFLHADTELLEKLQAAWVASASAVSEEDQSRRSVDVYSITVREIVLTELSNLVLWSFKTYFADTGEQPDASQVEAVMRLVRLVDSVALSRSRTYRSIVAPS